MKLLQSLFSGNTYTVHRNKNEQVKVAVEYCSLIPRPKGSGSETSDAATDLL